VQNVTNQFTRIAQDPRVNFFGNVNVGRDVTVDEIRKMYNTVSLQTIAAAEGRLLSCAADTSCQTGQCCLWDQPLLQQLTAGKGT
jgi:NADPH-dependent glutamate synthase beta subunit-like oxidoreductase